ncbi:hypothetical protein ASL20_09775 [Cupriavidus necator]|uniref:hypothetical protein n=1 Tax=Cupriavidus necator TaxID=106590 RepID=UPI000735A1AA|nr:hypothetical protein [Cupriavidus necator]KUE88901.1 hypothetical protein ASL20_09775 [Cupriavidus necator]
MTAASSNTAWAERLVAEYQAGRSAWRHTFAVYRMAYRALGKVMPDPPEPPPRPHRVAEPVAAAVASTVPVPRPAPGVRQWWQEHDA